MNAIKYSFLIITLAACFSETSAQAAVSISGRVIDAFTQEPLPGANIVILKTKLGATTNDKGEFSFAGIPEGVYNLQFSYIGYETRVITDVLVKSARPVVLTVALREQIIESETTVVTGGYFVPEAATAPSVLSLNREEIRRFPGGFEDAVRTVSTLPGITINNAGGRNDLLVRGGGPSENLYVIDNIEIPNINHFGTQGNSSGSLSFINLDLVEDITFSSGGFGAQFGDKMSSVLSLKTTNGRKERLGWKALISATQYGVNLDGPLGNNGNFIFSARQSYLDLIFKAAGLPFVPIYTDFNLIAKSRLPGNSELQLLLLGAIDRIDRDFDSEENRVTNAGILENEQGQWIAGLNYKSGVGKGSLDVTLNGNFYDFDLQQFDENQTTYFSSRSREREYGLKAQYLAPLNKRIFLLGGLSGKFIFNRNRTGFADQIYDRNGRQIDRVSIGLPAFIDNTPRARKFAAFTEANWQLTKRLFVDAGLRLDYFDFIDRPSSLGPRFALKYRYAPTQSAKLSIGRYYQSPSYVWLSNPNNRSLRALRNDMIIAGWEYVIREDVRLSVEGYYKKYDHLPTGTGAGINDYLVLTNTGTSYGGRDDDFQSFGYFDLVSAGYGMAYGGELLIEKKFSEIPFYGRMNLSLGKSEYTAANGRSYPGAYDQRFLFNLSGGYVLGNKWQFSAKFRYFSGIPYTPVYVPEQNPINPGLIQNLPEEYLSKRLPAGHQLDVRVDRFFNFRTWTLITYVDIQNIYNFKVPVSPTYDFWERTVDRYNSIALLPSIGISAEF